MRKIFFEAAHKAIDKGRLHVPPLGVGGDGRICPSIRSWEIVDQDQSDNLLTTYLITSSGQLAQNTAKNTADFPGSSVLANPSDNRVLNVFAQPALGCATWTAPDLANPGHQVPALALNEIQAETHQRSPQALIPAGDPFVLNPTFTGGPDLAKVNAYRRGVDQPLADTLKDASTTTYCRHVREIGAAKLRLDRPFFTAFRSPFPNEANSFFTFMALRFVGTYEMLNCQDLLDEPDPVTLIMTGDIVTDATIQGRDNHEDEDEE